MTRTFLAIASVVLLMGSVRADVQERINKGETAEHFAKNIGPLKEGIGKATKIALYEGLPHQTFENALLEKELKEKKTIKLHDFPFYATAIAPKAEDAKKLTDICSKAASFKRYAGPKRCGGFHPDWIVEWRDGDQAFGQHLLRL